MRSSVVALVPLLEICFVSAHIYSISQAGYYYGGGGASATRKRRIPSWGSSWNRDHDDSPPRHRHEDAPSSNPLLTLRGGYEENGPSNESDELSEKVRRAMIKLGLTPPDASPVSDASSSAGTPSSSSAGSGQTTEANDTCEGGVCELVPPKEDVVEPPTAVESEAQTQTSANGVVEPPSSSSQPQDEEVYDAEEDADVLAARLSSELGVDEALCLAAIGATATISPDGRRRKFNTEMARDLLKQELDRIATVGEDSADVQQLVSEGYDSFLSRRALAFADGDMDDARAILEADRMDEQISASGQQQERMEPPPTDLPMKTVTVDSSFDPTQLATSTPASSAGRPATQAAVPDGMPKPAAKADVVFEATAAQIQELVLESPVPVLLDVYADWCGPCKVLGPALEEMAVKSGGAFRLVKVNSDNERAIASSALGVTALPTVFGIRNGKILNMFQGMPRSEAYMKSFMMGLLVSESEFDPPVTAKEKQVYQDLTSKLVKMAGSASFPFSARERLQDRVVARLDELAEQASDFVEADESTQVLRSLLSNVIRDPSSIKFRTINLSNKVIGSKVARFPPSVAILKLVGFVADGIAEETLILGKGKKIVNVAPLMVARECIEKWVDKSRYEVAKAARKRRDEEERAKLQLFRDDDDDEADEPSPNKRQSSTPTRDPDACIVKVRFDGKNKIHELSLRADDPLSSVLDHLSVDGTEEIQITCVAKRLTISSSDTDRMQQSLRSLGLSPSSYLVVSIGDRIRSNRVTKTKDDGTSPSLAERAAAKQKQKRGSHTMQSVGIYAKDDNNKAELIDGGGGVWYEHDVSDDEQAEEKKEEESPDAAPKSPNETNDVEVGASDDGDEEAEEEDESESSDDSEEDQ